LLLPDCDGWNQQELQPDPHSILRERRRMLSRQLTAFIGVSFQCFGWMIFHYDMASFSDAKPLSREIQRSGRIGWQVQLLAWLQSSAQNDH
jgi:hypothetical protein